MSNFFEGVTLIVVISAIFTFLKWIIERRDLKAKNDIELLEKIKNIFSEQNSLFEKKLYSENISDLKRFKKIEHRKAIFETDNSYYLNNIFIVSDLANDDLLEWNDGDKSFQTTKKSELFLYSERGKYCLIVAFSIFIFILLFICLEKFKIHFIYHVLLMFLSVGIVEIPLLNHLQKIEYLNKFNNYVSNRNIS